MEAWLSVLPGTLTGVALVSLALAVVLLLAALLAFARGRLFVGGLRFVFAAFFAVIVAFLAAIAVGVRGYQALTQEDTAAVVSVEPSGTQRFLARFLFPDGHTVSYSLAGDELYVDARIIKWKYWANVAGLKTVYELDRVGGRYREMGDELSQPRTLQSLAQERPVDLLEMRRRFQLLSPLYDADYGSATFVPGDRAAMYEIQVSTTGLLARPVRSASDPLP